MFPGASSWYLAKSAEAWGSEMSNISTRWARLTCRSQKSRNSMNSILWWAAQIKRFSSLWGSDPPAITGPPLVDTHHTHSYPNGEDYTRVRGPSVNNGWLCRLRG